MILPPSSDVSFLSLSVDLSVSGPGLLFVLFVDRPAAWLAGWLAGCGGMGLGLTRLCIQEGNASAVTRSQYVLPRRAPHPVLLLERER